MNEIFIVELYDNINISKYNAFYKFIKEESLDKIKNFCLDINQKQSMLSEIIVRCLACKYLHIENKSLKFSKNKYGKPYLKNNKNFHYNISHSEHIVCCCISDNEVGIDVEKVVPIDYEKIIERFFTQREKNYIMSHQDKAIDRFFEIWTTKESYIKYLGRGLSLPLNEFDIFDDDIKSIVKSFKINGYYISLCSKWTSSLSKLFNDSCNDFLEDYVKLKNFFFKYHEFKVYFMSEKQLYDVASKILLEK